MTNSRVILNQNDNTYVEGKLFEHNAFHAFELHTQGSDSIQGTVLFQLGPIKEHGVNGFQNEDLIEMVMSRLQSFQASSFACEENALALVKLKEALEIMKSRTANRIKRNVEGKYQK